MRVLLTQARMMHLYANLAEVGSDWASEELGTFESSGPFAAERRPVELRSVLLLLPAFAPLHLPAFAPLHRPSAGQTDAEAA